MWGVPQPLDPLYICGQSQAPAAIAGRYQLHARGVQQPCAFSGEQLEPRMLDLTLTMIVTQDSAQPSRGTLTVSGTGHRLIDDRSLPADLARRRGTARAEGMYPPSMCVQSDQLALSYDFEGFSVSELRLDEVNTPECSDGLDDYCKGSVQLTLSDAHLEP